MAVRYTAEAAVKSARGFHNSAALLEGIYKEETAALGKTGTGLDHDTVNILLASMGSAIALEALAVELVLKARLVRGGVRPGNIHDHAKLFAELPTSEQEAARRYQESRHPAMRATLKEALDYSSSAFQRWRYPHERPSVNASLGEMQHAFGALHNGL
jgi:hypothetical protein